MYDCMIHSVHSNEQDVTGAQIIMDKGGKTAGEAWSKKLSRRVTGHLPDCPTNEALKCGATLIVNVKLRIKKTRTWAPACHMNTSVIDIRC